MGNQKKSFEMCSAYDDVVFHFRRLAWIEESSGPQPFLPYGPVQCETMFSGTGVRSVADKCNKIV